MKCIIVSLVLVLCSNVVNSQSIELFGKIDSSIDNENIHVINKTAQVFTISNKNGEFQISVKLNDTLSFSSIQHLPKDIIISKDIILRKTILVELKEQVNELDQVVVGKLLTGDLMLDVQNTEGDAPVNFYDVGIPGYTGKIATQSERRLHEATTGGGIVPLNPIINAISGRTKKLKSQIRLEKKDNLIKRIKARLSEDFFETNPLADELKMDFLYFCMDDKNFIERCSGKSDIEIFSFLKVKYDQYQENLSFKKD
ncbi:hypothetical protein VOI54_00500 [Tamlana sp. 2201CG12-4]|uniref:hypothetical protein n=1 Tax=Tamlana sp. 2201CG12-4 TaxID=3112582 RepID=UPI002DB87EE1|nr:hypothetical protein [Tamlana sp. 2201CG12-4]MEC3905487.1 hypothetical protein [Tamlana sp. 2201CG12-4]